MPYEKESNQPFVLHGHNTRNVHKSIRECPLAYGFEMDKFNLILNEKTKIFGVLSHSVLRDKENKINHIWLNAFRVNFKILKFTCKGEIKYRLRAYLRVACMYEPVFFKSVL